MSGILLVFFLSDSEEIRRIIGIAGKRLEICEYLIELLESLCKPQLTFFRKCSYRVRSFSCNTDISQRLSEFRQHRIPVRSKNRCLTACRIQYQSLVNGFLELVR